MSWRDKVTRKKLEAAQRHAPINPGMPLIKGNIKKVTVFGFIK